MNTTYLPMEELPVQPGLPDVLEGIQTAEEWMAHRDKLKALLEHYMLGHRPVNDLKAKGETLSSESIYDGRALREQVRVDIGHGESFEIYVVRPADDKQHPAVIWNYFKGRGVCPIEEELICKRGYVLAGFENNAVCVDDKDNPASPAKRAYPEADWAAIMIWSWGFSKILDVITDAGYADPKRIIVSGHSRNGKAALVAGAFDERIAMVVSNNSGCGGSGCFRFLGDQYAVTQDSKTVESLGSITHTFPHWFAPELQSFGSDAAPYPVTYENRLPFDLNALKALVAPRVLYTNEGTADLWANTHGSVLTRQAAQGVFDLLGVPGNNLQTIRDGGHGQEARDWRLAIDIADQKLR